jgi:hypothetical protein
MNDNRFSGRSDHQDKPNTINKIHNMEKLQMFINLFFKSMFMGKAFERSSFPLPTYGQDK